MSWIVLSIFSAVMLGIYDVAKKLSVRENAVPIVLLANVMVGAAICAPLIFWSAIAPESVPIDLFRVDALSSLEHVMIFAKAALVGASWTFAFFALKHLPLSIAAPIRATSPFWTILIAIPFLGERPDGMQWVGMAITLVGFWMFSIVGSREGIRFTRNRWVGCMIIATLLGAMSGIYDKILMQNMAMRPTNVQAWFAVYLVPVMMPLALRWYLRDRRRNPFHWRRVILTVSPLLLIADMLYFTAIADPESMISIISTVRRCSVVIAFAVGIKVFGEANFWPKAYCILAIALGVLLLTMQSG
ncbi:MAG: EamA family transporter [Pirellulaceae bacterium]|nr:EamA family transporter [Pirellulaceae bacterium]